METRSRVKNVRAWCNVVYRIGLVEITSPILEQTERLVKENKINSILVSTDIAHRLSLKCFKSSFERLIE